MGKKERTKRTRAGYAQYAIIGNMAYPNGVPGKQLRVQQAWKYDCDKKEADYEAYTGKEEKTMRHTTHITIEHVVVASNQPYEKVIDAFEARLGPAENWEEIIRPLLMSKASWELVTQTIEEHIGASGLTFFLKIEERPLLSLAGKTSRATQYTIGNQLFATRMTMYMPEAALYAPLKLVVYEDEDGRTFVAYDNFVSLLVQYQSEQVSRVAQIVEQKLEALVAEVTAG